MSFPRRVVVAEVKDNVARAESPVGVVHGRDTAVPAIDHQPDMVLARYPEEHVRERILLDPYLDVALLALHTVYAVLLDGVLNGMLHVAYPVRQLGHAHAIFDGRPVDDACHASFFEDITQFGVFPVIVGDDVFRYELIVKLSQSQHVAVVSVFFQNRVDPFEHDSVSL